jgi:tetratricopeptide (TPR) repeat protein
MMPRRSLRLFLAVLVATPCAAACVNGPRWEQTLARGKAAFDQGRLADAEAAFRDALAQANRLHWLHPYQLETNTELARLYFRQGRHADARAALGRVVARLEALYTEAHPGLARLHHDMGRASDLLNEHEVAEHHYRRALPVALARPVENQLAYLYIDLAVNAIRRGRRGEATRFLDLAEATAREYSPSREIFEEIRQKRAESGGGPA